MSKDVTIVKANEIFPQLGNNAHYQEVYDLIKKIGINGRKSVIDVYAKSEIEMVEKTIEFGIITVEQNRSNPMIGFAE